MAHYGIGDMKKRKAFLIVSAVVVGCFILSVGGICYYKKREENRRANMEVILLGANRSYLNSLAELEEYSTIIVEGKAGKEREQRVLSTTYVISINKELPGEGYTNQKFNVTKVYSGDVKEGDKISVSQQCFTWKYEDGTERLISRSAVKPYEKGETYLLFLKYNENRKVYEPVCDYQGIYPVKEMQKHATTKNITQADLSYIYHELEWEGLISMYEEVRRKYFEKQKLD